ncbi:MAG: T9SS type A sorting domain-containing protein [Flavobacteriales bacterium]|nr:T9SS type A sorting domain-containing protein [Flavobacteriales bacterium]
MKTKASLATIALIFAMWISAICQNEYFSNNVSWGLKKGINEPFYMNYYEVGYVVGGDTVMNDILYKVLYEDGIVIVDDQVSPWDPPGSVGYYNESPYHNQEPIGFYRSEGKKIYRYNTVNLTEFLLYDFDVEIGDTMDVSHEMFYGNVIVYDIDSMIVGGEWRKVIYASMDTEPLITDLFVEGIGNLTSGLDGLPVPNVSSVLFDLICYSYNGYNYLISYNDEDILDTSDYPCEYAVGIHEQDRKVSYNIYPNPTQDELRINLLDEHMGDQITFADITGRIIHQQKISQTMISFDASALPEGLYILDINGEVSKVVVER